MAAYLSIIAFLFILRYLVYTNPILVGSEKRNFIIISLLPVTLVAGLRGAKVGADTLQYIRIFNQISQAENFLTINKRIEPGYIYFNKIVSLVTFEAQWLFILVAVFFSVCVGFFIYKNAKDPFLAILFFITLGLFQFSLSGMRQTIAIGITILSFELIKSRRLVWFLLVISIAFTFHKSAILFVPAYFVANFQVNYKTLILYIVLLIFILLSIKTILFGTASILDYNYGIEETGNGQIFFILVLLVTIFGFLFRRAIIQQDEFNSVFLNINFISLFLWIIRLFSRTAERVTFYYMPSTYLVLEETISSIDNRYIKMIVYFIISALSTALFIYRLSNDKTITPYNFF